MAAISHGMNIEQVTQLGNLLKQKQQDIESLIQQVTNQLHNTAWEGPDAVAFKTHQWPEHTANLRRVAEAIGGFGQSALNNAREQGEVSSR